MKGKANEIQNKNRVGLSIDVLHLTVTTGGLNGEF
jgi:hypothetical protein